MEPIHILLNAKIRTILVVCGMHQVITLYVIKVGMKVGLVLMNGQMEAIHILLDAKIQTMLQI